MNQAQRDAIDALAKRYNSNAENTDVQHNPWDLPAEWVHVIIFRPEVGKPPKSGRTMIHCGVDPRGGISS